MDSKKLSGLLFGERREQSLNLSMSAKTYFYSERGITQNGPFTLEELKQQKIDETTLIWFEGEQTWKPLKTYPELLAYLKPENSTNLQQVAVPPPLPKTPYNSLQIKVRAITILFVWTAIHLFALLMSYTGVKFFNTETPPDTDKFWPFVEFHETYYSRPADASTAPGASYIADKNTEFNGIFYQYDWTEFALYVGMVWVFFMIVRLSRRKNGEIVK